MAVAAKASSSPKGFSKRPKPEFRVEHTAHAAIDGSLVQPILADGLGDAGVVAGRTRELDVEPRPKCLDPGVGDVGRRVLPGVEGVHGAIVGHGQALEPESTAEHVGQKTTRRGGGLTVHVGIGAHDRFEAGFVDSGAEWSGVHLEQLALTKVDGSDIPPTVRQAVAEEVFSRGEHAAPTVVTLEPADKGHADGGAQIWILAIALLDPTPPSVTSDVQIGRTRLVDPKCSHLTADDVVHGLD